MPVAPDAVIQDEEGRTLLRFERSLSHPPERVWEALTDGDQQRAWHPTPAAFEPRAGGTVTYLAEGDVEMPPGEVTEFEPPRVLAHTWGDDLLRWELQPQDDGCLLILTHRFEDRYKAARDAAGWHICLDSLASSLDAGEPQERSREDEKRRHTELNSAYEEKFGIPAEKATPPPAGP